MAEHLIAIQNHEGDKLAHLNNVEDVLEVLEFLLLELDEFKHDEEDLREYAHGVEDV